MSWKTQGGKRKFINVNLDKEKRAQTFYRSIQHLLLYQFNVCFVVISNVFVDMNTYHKEIQKGDLI